MPRCDERIPAVSGAYFASFTPEALALVCEAALLQHKLGVMAGIEMGLFWAGVRAIEREEARCEALSSLTSAAIEASYSRVLRRLPGDITWERAELNHGLNLLSVLPPRLRPGARSLDFRREVTAGILLAEVIAMFDFKHGTNLPLEEQGLDPREVYAALVAPDGFAAERGLVARGIIPPDKQALYEAACSKAAYTGAWLLRDIHVAAARLDNDVQLAEEECVSGNARWQREIEFVTNQLHEGGCVPFVAFPGPRPWLPSACAGLGVPEPEGYAMVRKMEWTDTR